MAYVITEKCLGERYATCVAVCPVDCIHPGDFPEDIAEDEGLSVGAVLCDPAEEVLGVDDAADVVEVFFEDGDA